MPEHGNFTFEIGVGLQKFFVDSVGFLTDMCLNFQLKVGRQVLRDVRCASVEHCALVADLRVDLAFAKGFAEF